MDFRDRDPDLFHGVTVADCYTVVLQGLVVDSDAERGSNGVLTTVTASYGVFFIVLVGDVVLEDVHDFLGLGSEPLICLQKGKDRHLDGSDRSGDMEDYA